MASQSPQETETPAFRQLSVRVFIGLLVFLVLVIAATYLAIQAAAERTLVQQAEKLHREIGQKIVLKLGERVSGTEALTRSLANLAEALPREQAIYGKVLPELLNSEEGVPPENRLIAGGGIWPEPGAFEEGVNRRSFFWSRNAKGELVYYDDYNEPSGSGYHNEEWYVPARYLKKGEVYWSKSYMDPYSFVPMVTCTAPYWRNGQFAGVATVDLRLDGISEFMAEQAEHVDGYAFAVDRNNRLISFPDAALGKRSQTDKDGNEVVEYRLVGEVAPESESFSRIAARIENFSTVGKEGLSSAVVGESTWLASKIASESYQIDEAEALRIAESLMSRNGIEAQVEQFRLEGELFLEQSSLISLFSVPSTDWKVLVAMPAAYSDKAVANVVGRVSKTVLGVVSLICLLLYAYLWFSIFSPVKALRGEVRKLALGGPSGARLGLEGDDELGRIAYWFNRRTDQLNAALAELKTSNASLEEAKLAAETASRTKNVFLASMSHEIRTPMNAIIGLTALLSEMEMSKDQRNFVEAIRTSSESLLSLINDILDFTKIEANELDLEEVAFDLRQVMEELSKMIAVQAEEKGLGLSCYLQTEVEGRLLGDPGRLRQILLNLASNAIKFTISGRVDIAGKCIEESDTHQRLEFCVKDTGIGIPESAFENLFDSFRQVDSTTTRKFGGTGLGLAISKRLCDKMQGEIAVSSKQGLGSEFTFTVLLKKAPRTEGRRSQEPLATGWAGFVVDNDWPHGEMLQAELRWLGIESRLYKGLEELEVALAEQSGQVVVFAGQVHGLSHEQLLKNLVRMKVPALNGVVSFASSVRAYALNPSVKASLADSVDKPFSRSELERCVRKLGAPGGEFNDRSLEREDDGIYAGYKVLLVEDHPVNQKVASRILSTMGVSCLVAGDGQEAVDLVSRCEELDAIVMDWQMPIMDGLDAARRIRKMDGWRSKIPIVAMTANAMHGDRDACLRAGMDDYVSKPVVPEDLRAALGRIFRREQP
ncbi:ATP-binding protein [Pelagicoccus enzymogenes]|uniref:response regulator n=1 Tax=Pelagicoccus enzymogenes TaxID=2773457 RepID=UPI002810903A|nr:response regulator [Pelagicoccus enzymogenes]MDQ8199474.1 ATP-binding protein [Pelagicoccus enzymogenes]